MKLHIFALFFCVALLPSVHLKESIQQGSHNVNKLQSTVRVPANVEAVQEIIDGVAKQADYPSPNVTSCLNEGTAIEIIFYFNDILNRASNKELLSIPDRINQLKKSTKTQIAQCWDVNKDFQGIYQRLGNKDISLKKLYLKFAEYSLTGNYDALVQSASDIRTAFNEGRYEDVGKSLGELITTVLTYQSDAEININSLMNKDYKPAFLEKIVGKMQGLRLYSYGWNNFGNYGNIDELSSDDNNSYSDYNDGYDGGYDGGYGDHNDYGNYADNFGNH